ncbi:hypothetical protein ACOMHN_050624 [Nucella lapillus]
MAKTEVHYLCRSSCLLPPTTPLQAVKGEAGRLLP